MSDDQIQEIQRSKAQGSAPAENKLSGYEVRDALRRERRAQLDGANGVGPARTQRQSANTGGRNRIELVDELILEFTESNGKGASGIVTYCVACDRRTVGRDSKRIFDHAALKCIVSPSAISENEVVLKDYLIYYIILVIIALT